MELERFEERGVDGRTVQFDLLKEWVANTWHLRVDGDEGCPWLCLALAMADAEGELGHSACHARERELRSLVVQTYKSLGLQGKAKVVAAKLRCKLSIFRILRYQEEEALQHWNWYLYCLTLDSHYFAQHSISGARCAVRMPMDSVDMYLLARILKVQIVVSQLWEPALCFSPREEVFFSVHLVTHGGLWAAALQPDGFSLSGSDLTGSVVELETPLAAPLSHLAGQSAYVLRYDAAKAHYVACVHQSTFPLQRGQIRHVIVGQEEFQRRHRHPLLPALCGIPDASFEFQMLLQLLCLELCQRLDLWHEELAGRPPRRVEPPQKLDLPPSALCDSSLPMSEVLQLLDAGSKVWIRSAIARRNVGELLSCDAWDFVCLRQVVESSDPTIFWGHTVLEQRLKQVSCDVVCSWAVLQDFVPQPAWPRFDQLLRLSAGDILVVTGRMTGKWAGWALGRVCKTGHSGLFPLQYVRPQLWIAKVEKS
ncbi:unnamed protein product [Effrenium voratum]|nr:unnamed protein product [Effrenium voratum]